MYVTDLMQSSHSTVTGNHSSDGVPRLVQGISISIRSFQGNSVQKHFAHQTVLGAQVVGVLTKLAAA